MITKNNIMKTYSLFAALMLLLIFTVNASDAPKNKSAKLPMLWDFGSKKCFACKKMAPFLEKMEGEYKGEMVVKFTDVWMPENVQVAKEHEIKSIPTQIFFNETGTELWRHVGYISEEDILAKWKELGYNFNKTVDNAEISKQESVK